MAKARCAGWLLPAHEAAIQLLRADNSCSKVLLEVIKNLGRCPVRQYKADTDEAKIENNLAQKLERARSNGCFLPEHEAVIELLRPAQKTSLEKAANESPVPMATFASEADNKLDQDLMLLCSGIRPRPLMRRFKKYQEVLSQPSDRHSHIVQRYADRIRVAVATPVGKRCYVAGNDIAGEELRTFADEPIICGPLVCQLCDADFVNEIKFAQHKSDCHAGETEYRKRVLFLMAAQGCRPITGQEKRIMAKLCTLSTVLPPMGVDIFFQARSRAEVRNSVRDLCPKGFS